MHVADLGFYSLELVGSSDHVVKQIPDFPFFEKAIDFEPVLDFSFKNVWKVFENDLYN